MPPAFFFFTMWDMIGIKNAEFDTDSNKLNFFLVINGTEIS